MASNLPPLNFKDEVEQYDSFQEKRDIVFHKCPHKQTTIVGNRLKCSCGAAWNGPASVLLEVQRALNDRLR